MDLTYIVNDFGSVQEYADGLPTGIERPITLFETQLRRRVQMLAAHIGAIEILDGNVERDSDAFYAITGMMPPGKDSPSQEIASQRVYTRDQVRQALWDVWCRKNKPNA